jgi:hypothetical protein
LLPFEAGPLLMEILFCSCAKESEPSGFFPFSFDAKIVLNFFPRKLHSLCGPLSGRTIYDFNPTAPSFFQFHLRPKVTIQAWTIQALLNRLAFSNCEDITLGSFHLLSLAPSIASDASTY